MVKMSTLALVAGLALALGGGAQAQSAGPQIPTPANPFPEEPIATDGTRLWLGDTAHSVTGVERLHSGRSVGRDADADRAR